MENTPITSVNSELISAGLNPNNPQNTTVDFAQAMTKARQDQSLQEQAIARAKELTVQSQVQTSNALDAQAQGINPLTADYLTPEQAIATLRLLLEEKGLPVDEDKVAEFAKSLGNKPVNRQVVAEFANRLSGERTRAGQSAMFTTDTRIKVPEGKSATDLGLEKMKDADGNSVDDRTKSDGRFIAFVPEDGSYQVIYDNQSRIEKIIPGGKEPSDGSAKLDAKSAESSDKQWQKLDTILQGMVATTRRSGLINTITRAKSGLSLIPTYRRSPTKQTLNSIEKDVASIMTGGIATGEASKDAEYKNLLLDLNTKLGYWTGSYNFFTKRIPLDEILGNIQGVLIDLFNTAIDTISKQIKSEEVAYETIITARPDKWQKMINDKIGTLGLPDDVAADLGVTNLGRSVTAAPAHDASVVPVKAPKVVPKYEVAE